MSKDKQALDELIATANATAEKQGKDAEEDTENGAGREDGTGNGEDGGAEDKAAAAGADDKGKETPRKDPTEGMTAEQKVDYWQKRANRHYADYQKEKTKRQTLQRGGLADAGRGTAAAPAAGANGKAAPTETPTSLDEVENLGQFKDYILSEARRQITEEWTEKDLDARVESTESKARQLHNGEDGFPEYDEVVDTYVVPLIEKNPTVFKLLRLLDDPGEAAYTLGMLRGFPKFVEQLKGKGREDLAKTINDATKNAALVRGRGGRPTSAKLTKADIDAMSPEDFEKEISKVKGEG
jgi:hypothetical protein